MLSNKTKPQNHRGQKSNALSYRLHLISSYALLIWDFHWQNLTYSLLFLCNFTIVMVTASSTMVHMPWHGRLHHIKEYNDTCSINTMLLPCYTMIKYVSLLNPLNLKQSAGLISCYFKE